MMSDTLLKTRELRSGYGSIPVLHGIDMEVPAGRCIALLGRNGAGKTTLLKTLMGLVRASSGRIELAGTEIAGWRASRIAKHGVAYVPQGRGIFPRLSVIENLQVGTRAARSRATIPDEIFRFFPILAERRHQFGGTLSGGQQQMLAIGRALCARPRLILLDEPSEGIQPSIVHEIGETLGQLVRETGVSILLVEQNLELALRLADHCLVLDKGELVHEGSPEEFQDAKVQATYLAI